MSIAFALFSKAREKQKKDKNGSARFNFSSAYSPLWNP